MAFASYQRNQASQWMSYFVCNIGAEEHGCRKVCKELWNRLARHVKAIIGMTISRLILHITIIWIRELVTADTHTHTIAELVTALVITAMAAGGIIAVDKCADRLEDHAAEAIAAASPPKTAEAANRMETIEEDEVQEGSRQPLVRRLAASMTVPLEVHLEDHAAAARGFIGVFGLVVGLSWEEVFMVGNMTLSRWIGEYGVNNLLERLKWPTFHDDHLVFWQLLLTFTVIAIMVPGWAKHIIPRANMTKDKHKEEIEEEQKNEKTMFNKSQRSRLWGRCCLCCRESKTSNAAPAP